jgi:hypothetical protein
MIPFHSREHTNEFSLICLIQCIPLRTNEAFVVAVLLFACEISLLCNVYIHKHTNSTTATNAGLVFLTHQKCALLLGLMRLHCCSYTAAATPVSSPLSLLQPVLVVAVLVLTSLLLLSQAVAVLPVSCCSSNFNSSAFFH